MKLRITHRIEASIMQHHITHRNHILFLPVKNKVLSPYHRIDSCTEIQTVEVVEIMSADYLLPGFVSHTAKDIQCIF